MKTSLSVGHRALCEARLCELNKVDMNNLTEFAERRLAAAGLNPAAGEDVIQRAMVAILQGLESDQGGRVPRLMDIENQSAFLNYSRGVISSIIEAMGRKRELRAVHEPLEDSVIPAHRSPVSPAELAELSDLKSELFSRLRIRAPQRLQRTLDAWESVFTESDRIPAPGHRKYIREVKELAQTIIAEIGGLH
jgi:hypothetical protein